MQSVYLVCFSGSATSIVLPNESVIVAFEHTFSDYITGAANLVSASEIRLNAETGALTSPQSNKVLSHIVHDISSVAGTNEYANSVSTMSNLEIKIPANSTIQLRNDSGGNHSSSSCVVFYRTK